MKKPKEINFIPQVHEGNDVYYWTEAFPASYKDRTITPLTWLAKEDEKVLCSDGDFHFELIDGKHRCFCNCCGKEAKKMIPKLFGSVDVGIEIIYKCPNCDEGRARIYSMIETADESF